MKTEPGDVHISRTAGAIESVETALATVVQSGMPTTLFELLHHGTPASRLLTWN